MPLPNRFMQIAPGPDPGRLPGIFNTIVEIPKGRRSKFEIDKQSGLIKLDRYPVSYTHLTLPTIHSV